MNLILSVFDEVIPYSLMDMVLAFCKKSTFRLGWPDGDDTDLNLHSTWTKDELKSTGLIPYFDDCIKNTEWFVKNDLHRIILNVVKSNDVHYIHHHEGEQVLLYYVNLDWQDGWYGETLFFNPSNIKEVQYTSSFQPGRIILFDGSIPHAIRPQSIKAPKFRFTLSLFFV